MFMQATLRIRVVIIVFRIPTAVAPIMPQNSRQNKFYPMLMLYMILLSKKYHMLTKMAAPRFFWLFY